MAAKGHMVAWAGPGDMMASRDAALPRLIRVPWLRKTWDDLHPNRRCRYGTMESGPDILGVYLPEASVPKRALRVGARPMDGRWVTATVHLGPHKAYHSPEVFFRQMDLDDSETWLAVGVLRVTAHLEPRPQAFEDSSVLYEWGLLGTRYYYVEKPGKWALYGGGNTSPRRIEEVRDTGGSASDFLWSIGAVRLGP